MEPNEGEEDLLWARACVLSVAWEVSRRCLDLVRGVSEGDDRADRNIRISE